MSATYLRHYLWQKSLIPTGCVYYLSHYLWQIFPPPGGEVGTVPWCSLCEVQVFFSSPVVWPRFRVHGYWDIFQPLDHGDSPINLWAIDDKHNSARFGDKSNGLHVVWLPLSEVISLSSVHLNDIHKLKWYRCHPWIAGVYFHMYFILTIETRNCHPCTSRGCLWLGPFLPSHAILLGQSAMLTGKKGTALLCKCSTSI